MQRFVIFICNVFYSFELGFLIPLLPGKIICIYNLFVFRLLRLLGGLSVLFYVTDYYLCFNCSIQICIIFLVTLHGFLMIILVLNSILFSVVLFREPIFEMYVFNFNYRIFKSVVCFVLVCRIIIIVSMECIGFLGFNYLFLDICRGIVDIK